ncbi:MAG: DNA repair protein [Clostridia bacterium]|nr:DNA repair protein [Clostridia bacterium]
MEKIRCYFVIDMKSFYASVECAERDLDPMKTKLVVADKTKSQGTICLAVSPALKCLGVKNRCRLFEIPKDIDFIIAKPRMKRYIDYASEIYGIYLKYMDKSDIHVYSIDESFLDVTDYLKLYNKTPLEFAKMLMAEIFEKLRIPSSVGIGTNLYLAKVALDITAKNSQDKIGWLCEEKFKKTLWNHTPLSDFWQISTGISKRLLKYGITDMEGISKCNPDLLYNEFGINAELLIDHSNGKESCLMSDIKEYKSKSHSISNSQILPCNYNYKDAFIVFQEMINEGVYRLIKEDFVTSLINLCIGYGDDRTVAKGSIRMNISTNLFSKIMPYAEKLFKQIVDKERPIRKIMYSYGFLEPTKCERYDFFTDYDMVEKEKRLIKSVMEIKKRFGKNSILKGIDFVENATQRQRNQEIGGHNSDGENEDE